MLVENLPPRGECAFTRRLWLMLEYVDLLDEDDYRRALRGETEK